jgi:protein O-GlcNAc transferase
MSEEEKKISDAGLFAAKLLREGRLAEAEQAYRQLVANDPNCAESNYFLATVLQTQGKQAEAVDYYRRALTLKPDLAEARNNLGNALQSLGRLSEAIDSYLRAIELRPDDYLAYCNLGTALQHQGRLDLALSAYERALSLRPDLAVAHYNLGTALQVGGRLEGASDCFRKAIELEPNHCLAHFNLGNVLADLGKHAEAALCFSRALEVQPDFPEAHHNLGTTFLARRQYDEAVACFQRVLALRCDFSSAYLHLASAYHQLGRVEEAVAALRRAVALDPAQVDALKNLGTMLLAQGKTDEAIACFRRVLEQTPRDAVAYNDLAVALQSQGKIDEAVACFEQAIVLSPDYVGAMSNLGNALQAERRLDVASAWYSRALAVEPENARVFGNMLVARHYQAGVTLAELAEAHAEFERRLAAPLRSHWRRHENSRDPDRRLRVGIVSPDFGQHPVGYFLIGVLENLDRREVEAICYSDRREQDGLTARCARAAATWREVSTLGDEEFSELVRSDRIDILFDLAGHTARNRLLAFARKPAPIQISWAGYMGTTGLAAMDYILADRFEIPPEAERFYAERVLRMPDGYVCYEPPDYAPAVSGLPAQRNNYITLGSFNNPAKITAQVVEVWAKILRRLPEARLVLKYGSVDNPSVAKTFLDDFARGGIDPHRIDTLGRSDHRDFLQAYERIDLALDPFPYNGGLTTCEALWMGVPVVTLPGETFASRHSLSHLSVVGLRETIARDVDEYVELAVSLAEDWPRLAALRASLRERMAASPLCDRPGFARNLTRVLREVWREWCNDAKTSPTN